jgi:hypothetical protein
VGIMGNLLLGTIGQKRGCIEVNGYNSPCGKTSVSM